MLTACSLLLLLVFPVNGALSNSTSAKRATPIKGPYTPKRTVFTNQLLDSTDHRINVVYPAEAGNFPLIVYAHGLNNDAAKDYSVLFDGLVSFGYIIMAHSSCYDGCKDDKDTLAWDPEGFGHYYKQQLHVIEWAKTRAGSTSTDPVLSKVDFSHGIGIAGHSMGGQSTVFSASFQNATDLGITAAVMHHAFTHEYPAPQVPFLAFTGSEDYVAGSYMTDRFFSADGACPTKGMVDSSVFGHFEPEDNWLPWKTYNPLIPQFTAAWFKLHLEKKNSEFGVNFQEMIYGNGTQSLCHGGDGAMKRCEVHSAPPAPVVIV